MAAISAMRDAARQTALHVPRPSGVMASVSNYFVWLILSQITGSPIASGIAMLAFYWAVDRYTLGVLPDPFKLINRLRKQWKLETHLKIAPHDRKARADLAELYLWRRQYAKAVEVLRPSFDAGDDHIESVFTMGVACLGAGHTTQGEKLLAHALEMQKSFRNGEIHLELGRWRVKRGDFAGAKVELEHFIGIRKGTVEGRVLLAAALDGLKDDGKAALLRDEAWAEHAAAPYFQQRRQRLWAWRARPSRPALYAAALVLLVLLAKSVLPSLPAGSAWAAGYDGYDDYDGFTNGPKVAVFSYGNAETCTEVHGILESSVASMEEAFARQGSTDVQLARAPCSSEGAVAVCESPQFRMVWYRESAQAVQACQSMRGTLTVPKGP